MRKILPLFAAAVLSLITSAYAQDESASPAASPEESSSTNMQAPSTLRDVSSSPAAEAKATPAAKATKEAATSAETSSKKKGAAAETTEKKEKSETNEEAAAATAGPDKGKPESNVKRLETQWEASVMKHDTSFIDARVARDFVGVSSKGKRIDKGALLKEYKADTDAYSSARNTGVTVRAYASNVAVANGIAKEVGKSKEGTPFNRSYVWTDTWVLRGDQWQCVASHVMLSPGK